MRLTVGASQDLPATGAPRQPLLSAWLAWTTLGEAVGFCVPAAAAALAYVTGYLIGRA
jgi:hypothetical protein